MHHGPHAGIIVQRPRRDDHMRPAPLQHRHIRAANSAESARITGRRCIALNVFLPTRPAKTPAAGVKEAPERRAVRLAAHRAVTVIDELRRSVELELHSAAKA